MSVASELRSLLVTCKVRDDFVVFPETAGIETVSESSKTATSPDMGEIDLINGTHGFRLSMKDKVAIRTAWGEACKAHKTVQCTTLASPGFYQSRRPSRWARKSACENVGTKSMTTIRLARKLLRRSTSCSSTVAF